MIAAASEVTQPEPKDWAAYNSRVLTIAVATCPVLIEPLASGRGQMRLTMKRRGELQIATETFTVSMANGGFALTERGAAVMSGGPTQRTESVSFRVSPDGRSLGRKAAFARTGKLDVTLAAEFGRAGERCASPSVGETPL